MRAVVADRYGPPEVLRLEDVERPSPEDGEILVRVRATTVNRTDCALRAGDPPVARLYTGVRAPRWRILGSELAGEVAAVGAAVDEFRLGDRVFGENAGRLGAHAEYVCVRQDAPVAHMPAGMGFVEAAPVCDGAILALNCLRPARLRGGERVLVYGASGAIGTAAVQLAKRFGAHVTAVCAPDGLATVITLGADAVLDHTREDFTQRGEPDVGQAVGREVGAVWPQGGSCSRSRLATPSRTCSSSRASSRRGGSGRSSIAATRSRRWSRRAATSSAGRSSATWSSPSEPRRA